MVVGSASEFEGAMYLAGLNAHSGMSVSDWASISGQVALLLPQPSVQEKAGLHVILFRGGTTLYL